MILSEPTLAAVVAKLRAAFPAVPPPPLDGTSGCAEVEAAAKLIQWGTWRTAPGEVLDAVHDALPWLDVRSFVYWLPGLLVDLVNNPPRSGWYGDCLIMALTPTGAVGPA